MPALTMFYGIIIYMYCEQGSKHHKAHIHAHYQNYEVVLSLESEILEGILPQKQLKLVEAWISLHKEELNANWTILQSGQKFFPIEPLR